MQDILESWSTYINSSSLILYRAVGPYNRTILFGGKNPPLDKNDSRLRPVPFPTRRATFSEVKRVYDILSTMEIYGNCIHRFNYTYEKKIYVLLHYINFAISYFRFRGGF